jgi:hypothetical protein
MAKRRAGKNPAFFADDGLLGAPNPLAGISAQKNGSPKNAKPRNALNGKGLRRQKRIPRISGISCDFLGDIQER